MSKTSSALKVEVMDHHEKMRIRAAAYRVTRLYPGIVGEILSRELMTWEEFGYRFDKNGSVNRLIQFISGQELPPYVPDRQG